MAVALVYGFWRGGFFDEGATLVELAWGQVTLIDLYTGLFLFGGWIAVREGSWLRALPWWVGLVVLGNMVAAVYALTAAVGSGGDLRRLLLGRAAG